MSKKRHTDPQDQNEESQSRDGEQTHPCCD